MVFAQDEPAFVGHVEPRITKQAANGNQFFVVYLQDVASFERFEQQFFVIEVLTKVDIEDFKTVFWGGIEEAVNGVSAHFVALGQ